LLTACLNNLNCKNYAVDFMKKMLGFEYPAIWYPLASKKTQISFSDIVEKLK
jgi:hypothetical protein